MDPDCQVEVKLNHIAREPDNGMALVVKAMWDAVGIKTEISAQEVQAWVDINRGDDFEVTFWSGAPYGPDPDSEFVRVDRESGGNWNNNDTPGLQECYERGRAEFDQAKRTVIYNECYQILYEDAALGVSFIETLNYVHRPEVKGFGVIRLRFPYLHEVWLDR